MLSHIPVLEQQDCWLTLYTRMTDKSVIANGEYAKAVNIDSTTAATFQPGDQIANCLHFVILSCMAS